MWQCQFCLCVWEAPRGDLEPCDVILENCIPSCCRRCATSADRERSPLTASTIYAAQTTPPPVFLDAEEVFTKERVDASIY